MPRAQANSGFIVADMGGGTLDFSAYKMTGLQPLRVEEMAAARCMAFICCLNDVLTLLGRRASGKHARH
jgi:hypothetical protein